MRHQEFRLWTSRLQERWKIMTASSWLTTCCDQESFKQEQLEWSIESAKHRLILKPDRYNYDTDLSFAAICKRYCYEV